MTLYRIHWRAVLTGATDHGTGQFTQAEAERIAKELNKQDENFIDHWIEPVPDTLTEVTSHGPHA